MVKKIDIEELDPSNPPKDAVWFCPLGGSGEIGMNMNLYGHNGKWIMVDCGITFGNDALPGADVIMPDPAFIEDQVENLEAIFITHAHEDHMGAIPYLFSRFNCPIYSHPFTTAFIRAKCEDKKLGLNSYLQEVDIGGTVEAGPFSVEFLPVTHSVLEPAMLIIKTALGNILHTGDWKFDDHPVLGYKTDYDRLKALGSEGALAIVGDSTNAIKTGHTQSENDLIESFTTIFKKYDQRIVVGCFSSNLARLKSTAIAAKKAGRQLGIVGRSLWRMYDTAYECGYLRDIIEPLAPEDLQDIPPEQLVIIATGSQGEENSGLHRFANEAHPSLRLTPGDVVLFSARQIPGNERSIKDIQNKFEKNGIHVITSHTDYIHVSGHAKQDEIKQLYEWVKPQAVIPVHGEYRHMNANAELAEACGIDQQYVPEDGHLIELRLKGKKLHTELLDEVYTGLLTLEGNQVAPLSTEMMDRRKNINQQGMVFATVILNADMEIVSLPEISIHGLSFIDELQFSEDEEPYAFLLDSLNESISQRIYDLDEENFFDDEAVIQTLQRGIKRKFQKSFQLRPFVKIHLIRI